MSVKAAMSIVRLLLGSAALVALAAPEQGVRDFLERVRHGPAAPEPGLADGLAQLPGRNVLLRFEGFSRLERRPEFLYYRSVYVLWPRRALLGPGAGTINSVQDFPAPDTRIDHEWLAAHQVDFVARFQPFDRETVRLVIDAAADE
jgi:hypothetical protein